MKSSSLARATLPIFLLAACNDATSIDIASYLATDTLVIFTPTEANRGYPSAIDITSGGGLFAGERYPEESWDAELWDFTVREGDDALLLVPAAVIGLSSTASLTPAVEGYTFETLDEAPSLSTFQDTIGVPMELGRVYAAESRSIDCGSGTTHQYAKIQPLEIDIGSGMLRIEITGNSYCGDYRFPTL